MEKKKNIPLMVLSAFSIIVSFSSLVLFLIYAIKLLIKGNVTYGWISLISAIVFIAIEIFLVFLDNADKKNNKKKKIIFNVIFKYSTAILKTIVIVLSLTEAAKNNQIEAMDIIWLIWIQITLFVDIVLRITILIVKLLIFVVKKKIKKKKENDCVKTN